MAREVILPKFGFTLEESTIVAWLAAEGERVEQGDPIAEVTTDKVNMEVEAPADGIMAGQLYQPGDVVPVTEVICYILESEDDTVPDTPSPAAPASPKEDDAPSADTAASPVARRIAASEGVDLSRVSGSGPGGKIMKGDVQAALADRDNGSGRTAPAGRVRATPAARRVARAHDLALADITGSGPQGRVQEADVLAAVEQPTATPGGAESLAYEGMRQTIGQRLQTSWQQAPHITFTRRLDMTEAIEFRAYANERRAPDTPRISMTALIVKAVAWALGQHPALNAHFDGETIRRYDEVNIGVAVALDEGLIVPVVHEAQRRGLLDIGAAVADLTERARTGKLRAGDLDGGTFTVSNLGMFGVDQFTAIINPPEVGILAVGRIVRQFVPGDDDQPVARPLMTVTLAVDHRVIDGAVAAQFLASLTAALEEPATIIL